MNIFFAALLLFLLNPSHLSNRSDHRLCVSLDLRGRLGRFLENIAQFCTFGATGNYYLRNLLYLTHVLASIETGAELPHCVCYSG